MAITIAFAAERHRRRDRLEGNDPTTRPAAADDAPDSVCQELGVPIIGHSGPDRGGAGFAEPRAFGEALAQFPELNIVLAHLGGATWDQALEIAETYPNAYFDCCEIIEWTEGTNAPTEKQLARLIKDIGPQRVMMGSDYPWYDLDHTVVRVMELPILSAEEKAGILGRTP